MKDKCWFITDKGRVGYKMSENFALDSRGDVKVRLFDHLSVSIITGETSLNTFWGRDDRTVLESILG